MNLIAMLSLIGQGLLAAAPAPAAAPSPQEPPEILVVGLYHMANPGKDLYNLEADDVLAPRRQTEIAEVVEVLRRFRPTKVAVERARGDERIARDYGDYLAGRHELTRNEIEQLGFRLAKALGHREVFAIDADGDFPFQHLVNFAKATGRSAELETVMGGFGALAEEQAALLATHTVLETLLAVNAPERTARELAVYHQLARFGEPGDFAGADLVAAWEQRNLRIFTNLAQLAAAPGERILVLYGSGHLGWLQRAIAADSGLRLRTLAELVP